MSSPRAPDDVRGRVALWHRRWARARGERERVFRIPGVWARPGAWPCRAQTSWGEEGCPVLISLASVPDTKLGQSWETSKCLKLDGCDPGRATAVPAGRAPSPASGLVSYRHRPPFSIRRIANPRCAGDPGPGRGPIRPPPRRPAAPTPAPAAHPTPIPRARRPAGRARHADALSRRSLVKDPSSGTGRWSRAGQHRALGMGRPGCAGRPGQRGRIRGVRHADHWLGRHVAGRRREPVDRPVSHAVNRPRFRLRHADAFMTLQEIGEVLGLRGVHADDHARLAHRLLVRVPHVTGQWVRRPPEPVERSPALPCLFQPRRGVTGTRDQLRITHRAIPPHERDAMPRPPTETGRPYVHPLV